MDGVYSTPVSPCRGLTAGGGFATTEMRKVLINIIDRALLVAPAAQPTIYVDDLSVEVSGSSNCVFRHLVAFTNSFCREVTDEHMEVSFTKSLCTASSGKLGRRLQRAFVPYGIRFQWRVTSLGSALGAGTRRNATVIKKRLTDFRRRLPRFRKLAAVGASTKKLVRTGGITARPTGKASSVSRPRR